MRAPSPRLPDLLRADRRADRVVPPTGHTAHLTVFASAAMAFLAVFALALALTANRLSQKWETELAGTGTVRISASSGQVAVQTEAALRVLEQTPGIAGPRILSDTEQAELLAPWFGSDLPLDALPMPRLIEFREVAPGYDAMGLRLRLDAEAPGAVLDDHTRWRRPLVEAAERIRLLGFLSAAMIGLVVAALITLASGSALAANGQVIRVLRLVGARDTYIARAFVRRFTARALVGAAGGTAVGTAVVLMLPSRGGAEHVLSVVGFRGVEWLIPLGVPLLASAVAFVATRAAAFRALRGIR